MWSGLTFVCRISEKRQFRVKNLPETTVLLWLLGRLGAINESELAEFRLLRWSSELMWVLLPVRSVKGWLMRCWKYQGLRVRLVQSYLSLPTKPCLKWEQIIASTWNVCGEKEDFFLQNAVAKESFWGWTNNVASVVEWNRIELASGHLESYKCQIFVFWFSWVWLSHCLSPCRAEMTKIVWSFASMTPGVQFYC